MAGRKKDTDVKQTVKQVAKNLIPGAKRNGPFKPEELVQFGIRRPMISNYARARIFNQTARIFSELARELNTSVTLIYHLAALYMVEKTNDAHRATGAEGLRVDVSQIEKPTDYLPLEGPYKNWEERYAQVEQQLRSRNP